MQSHVTATLGESGRSGADTARNPPPFKVASGASTVCSCKLPFGAAVESTDRCLGQRKA
jgi:hypothetical protein